MFSCGEPLATFHAKTRYRILLPIFCVGSLVTGALSQYDHPPLTRLMFMAPIISLMAAAGLEEFIFNSNRIFTKIRPVFKQTLFTALTMAAAVLSMTHTQNTITHRYHGFGDGTSSEFIRIAQNLPETCPLIFIRRSGSFMTDLYRIADGYEMKERLTYFEFPSVHAILHLERIQPPCFIAHDLQYPYDIIRVQQTVLKRYPEYPWRFSAPGRSWSLNFVYIPEDY